MKLKELESLLQDVESFEDPKLHLEQYPTGAHLAATILHTINLRFESFDENSVIDLGTGTGILSIGCGLLDCPYVLGVDIDMECLATAQRNLEQFDDSIPIDFVCCDVTRLSPRMKSDIVVMNPPFGTKRKNADREFLQVAFSVADKSVYSLHKTSTRSFIHSFASKFVDSADIVAHLRYDLPRSYSFHKSDVKDIDVDLWSLCMTSLNSLIAVGKEAIQVLLQCELRHQSVSQSVEYLYKPSELNIAFTQYSTFQNKYSVVIISPLLLSMKS